MKVAIHQPNYLPYPGFFAKLFLSDIFVIYDTAQFTRGDFINRNRIRTFSYNGYMWLTLPVGKKNFKNVPINQVEIRDEKIFKKHAETLRVFYSKAPYFDEKICQWVETAHKNLSKHNIFLIKQLAQNLNIKHPRILLSSELKLPSATGTQSLLNIVKAVNGDTYISGTGAKAYLDEQIFQKENIKLLYLDYKPIIYPQIHPGFVENMSIVDAIFNVGWENVTFQIKMASNLSNTLLS